MWCEVVTVHPELILYQVIFPRVIDCFPQALIWQPLQFSSRSLSAPSQIELGLFSLERANAKKMEHRSSLSFPPATFFFEMLKI